MEKHFTEDSNQIMIDNDATGDTMNGGTDSNVFNF